MLSFFNTFFFFTIHYFSLAFRISCAPTILYRIVVKAICFLAGEA